MTTDTTITDRQTIAELRQENADLRAQLAGEPSNGFSRLLAKCDRQRAALDTLNRKVLTQRFVLRTVNELGRGLSADEYRAARDAVANEQTRERIYDEQPAA